MVTWFVVICTEPARITPKTQQHFGILHGSMFPPASPDRQITSSTTWHGLLPRDEPTAARVDFLQSSCGCKPLMGDKPITVVAMCRSPWPSRIPERVFLVKPSIDWISLIHVLGGSIPYLRWPQTINQVQSDKIKLNQVESTSIRFHTFFPPSRLWQLYRVQPHAGAQPPTAAAGNGEVLRQDFSMGKTVKMKMVISPAKVAN